VLDVVMMGRYGQLKFGQRPTNHDKKIALEALNLVKMTELQDYPIGQLSGGQQQRVFLARALAQQAEIFIMDEPFIGIDITTEKIILDLFLQLKTENKTIIVVHHDLITVKKYFDFIFFMNRKEIAYGPISTTMTPENISKTFYKEIETNDFNFL
jgi:manganese/zinc/iron transport system ATP- binding protein